MKYCTKCGKELFDEAVVCVDCGNVLSTDYEKEYKTGTSKNKSQRKTPLIVALIAVLVIAAVVGGFFVWRHMRTQNVIDDLAGQTFTNSVFNEQVLTKKGFSFDNEGILTYSYESDDWSNIYDDTVELERTLDYNIGFENDKVVLVVGSEKYEIQYATTKNGEEIIAGIFGITNDDGYIPSK